MLEVETENCELAMTSILLVADDGVIVPTIPVVTYDVDVVVIFETLYAYTTCNTFPPSKPSI